MRQKIILGLAGLLLIIGFVYAATHSIIAVTVPGDGGETYYTVTLTGSDGNKTEINASQQTVKKIVKKGSYTVLATESGSYFKSIETRGFLRTTAVTADLQLEAQRTFIADNPGACMHLLGDRLVSNNCSDTAFDYKEYVPASASLPGYVQTVATTTVYGFTKGFVTTKSGENILLLQDVEGVAGYYLQSVTNTLTGGPRIRVPVMNINADYTVKPFREGVVVFDSSYTDFLYYSDSNGQPEKIKFNKPKNSEFQQYQVTIGPDAITMVSSPLDKNAESSENEDDAPAADEGSEVLVYRAADNQQQYEFTQTYLTATACGSDKLCAINQSGLSVYTLDGGKAKRSFDMPQITELYQMGGRLLGMAEDGVYSINADEGSGFIDYSFGKYQPCAVEAAPRGYLLCVFDDNGNKSALYLDSELKNTDSIDKKILAVRAAITSADVSVNGRFIYVVPDYGDPIYDAKNKIYIPDPAKAKITNNAISSAIAKSNIDLSRFTVINTGTQ